jgi:hypothetical protein
VGKIDKLVFARLKALGLQPSPLCSDAVFVRRVYLDVIGTLPTAAEAREFLLDRNPDKRRVLIDRLLERDEFADYWAMKWSDLLRGSCSRRAAVISACRRLTSIVPSRAASRQRLPRPWLWR